MMLDTNGSYPVDQAACIMWADNGGNTQKWRLQEVPASSVVRMQGLPDSSSGAVYRITSVSNPAVVVQLNASSPQSGAAANMDKPDGSASQVFTFDLQPDGT